METPVLCTKAAVHYRLSIIIIIYPLTKRVVGTQQMILQPVFLMMHQ